MIYFVYCVLAKIFRKTKKKQKTLGAFGFTKTVKHRGEPTVVDIPNEVDVAKYNTVECANCKGRFKTNQGLGVHKLSCVKNNTDVSKTKDGAHPPRGFTRPDDNQVTEADVDTVASTNTELATEPPTPNDDEYGSSKDVKRKNDETKIDGRKYAKGANKRRSYSAKFQADIIHQCQPGVSQHKIAEENNINQALISKWLKKKDSIIAAAVDQHKKLFTKQRPSTKYKQLYVTLYEQLETARKAGKMVNFNWLWTKARKIHREQSPDDGATVRKHVITTFLKKYNVRMRTRQRNRAIPTEAYRESLMKWHATTRERLVRTAGKSSSYDQKWGHYKPEQRFNVDQTPMPFAIDVKRTYEVIEPENKKHHKTWTRQPTSGLDKRQCTVQVCSRADGKQARIAIIFRGKGCNVRPHGKAAYHEGVDVYWQKDAWADTTFSVEWANRTLAPVVKDLNHFVLFADNLTAQTTDHFKSAVSNISGLVWFGLANATELWQVVDAGLDQTLKVLCGQSYQNWLGQEENADLWFCHGGKLTASERRILITQWVGNAWDKLCTPEYEHLR